MAQGTRFVAVPSVAIFGLLDGISESVSQRGGLAYEGVQGREVFYDIVPPHKRSAVRVYTSVARGAKEVRGCGEDAVRIVVGAFGRDEKFRPLSNGDRVFRTAPKGPEEQRVTAFLDRLRERVRDAYKEALRVPACPHCQAGMTIRTAKTTGRQFWGCTSFPECDGTRPYVAPDAAPLPSCPKCEAPMVERSSQGVGFYGCSKYPVCRGSRPMQRQQGFGT